MQGESINTDKTLECLFQRNFARVCFKVQKEKQYYYFLTIEELKNMKNSVDLKNLKIAEDEANIVKLTEANKKLQDMLNDSK